MTAEWAQPIHCSEIADLASEFGETAKDLREKVSRTMIFKVVKRLFKYQFSDLLSVISVDLFSPTVIFYASSAVYVSDNAAI